MASHFLKPVLFVVMCVAWVGSADQTDCIKCPRTSRINRVFCDIAYYNIFYGEVVGVNEDQEQGIIDYSVRISNVYRTQNADIVQANAQVVLTTPLNEFRCPIQAMQERDRYYFAVGKLGGHDAKKFIVADSCSSFITDSLPNDVYNDLVMGKYRIQC